MPRKSKVSKSQIPKPAANIAFVGEKDGLEPLRKITNGDQLIGLPEDQSKPFYHADAKIICRLFGWLYKPITSKG